MATPKETVHSACRHLMAPIVGILLRNGVTYKELSNLCKQLYVQVAAKEFGIRGRDTNLSRIAILTGIDRKEAARIKEELNSNDESDASQRGQDRMTRVLSGWHQDADFLTRDGEPLTLSFEGPLPNFSLLVKKYGGDMPAITILKEFKRCEVVTVDDAGNLHAVKRYYVPSQADPGALLRAGSVINDLSSTLYYNLYKAEPTKNKPLHFERRATNIQMSSEKALAFREFVEKEGQEFLEKIDAWLSKHESAPAQIDNSSNTDPIKTKTVRLGVGTYLIEQNFSETITSTKEQ
jgi:hypothetical protein